MTGDIVLPFPEYHNPPEDPIGLLRTWLSRADDVGVREPRALALATVAENGRPSSRIVAIAKVTAHGVCFASHTSSQKARDVRVNPYATGVLYWRETSQQIILSGPITLMSEDEANRSWKSRPAEAHPMSVAARQSDDLLDVEALREQASKLARAGVDLPCPDSYRVFELRPESMEFWADGQDRLHERLRFDRITGGWTARRLQP
nr:phenazine biosynthesis FMN-dependent oxidase PhzG [Roseospira marina]